MPNALAAKSCTPCRGGIPPLTIEEAQVYLAQAPDWDLLDDSRKIQRTYRFKNFREALGFVRRRASSPRPRGIIPTSPLAGAMPPSRCRPRRSKVCTRTTSSWRRSSTVCRRTNAGLIPPAPGLADQAIVSSRLKRTGRISRCLTCPEAALSTTVSICASAYPLGSACARCGVGMPTGAPRSWAGRSSRVA